MSYLTDTTNFYMMLDPVRVPNSILTCSFYTPVIPWSEEYWSDAEGFIDFTI